MKSLIMIAGLLLVQFNLERCSAGPRELSVGDYINWIENADNGLHPSRTINGYTFDLQYKPSEYVVIREQLAEPSTSDELKQQADSISDMQYFTLRISKENEADLLKDDVGSTDQFSSRLVYFTSAMQNDISLVDQGDTLPCCLFHFERTYSVDPRSTFLLGFPKGKKHATDGMKTLVFDDHELGTGTIMLTITQENIDRIPFIKLN